MFDANPFIGVVVFVCTCMISLIWIDAKPFKMILFRINFGVWPGNPESSIHVRQKLDFVRDLLLEISYIPCTRVCDDDPVNYADLVCKNQYLTDLATNFGIKY